MDVCWGRIEEMYGEDFFFIILIGSFFISIFEKLGIIIIFKYFVVNVGVGGRDSYLVFYSNWYFE